MCFANKKDEIKTLQQKRLNYLIFIIFWINANILILFWYSLIFKSNIGFDETAKFEFYNIDYPFI